MSIEKYILPIRAISGSILVVSLIVAAYQKLHAPNSIVTESSTILPDWVDWLGYSLTVIAAASYNLADYLDWLRPRH